MSEANQNRRLVKPRVGDIWEVIIPATEKRKRKRVVKEIGEIYMGQYLRGDKIVRHPYCAWKRLPKGRYSGIRAKWLLKYGTRLSTKEERETEYQVRLARKRAERGLV